MNTILSFKTVLCSLCILIATQTLNSQTKTEQLDELIGLYHEYGTFNGSVLVAEKGEVIYEKGFGMANMEWDIPNAPNTKHRLGSISKQFTGMLILQLVAEGKIDVQKPVSTYLPEYPKPQADDITVHHLLTHTSGIPNYTSFPNFFENVSMKFFEPKEFINEFADMDLEFIPGDQFSYSNSGYFLLGVLIEEVTGKSYEENLEERIFAPLKMTSSGYDHHGEIIKNRATGYEKAGMGYENSRYLDMSIPYSAGSLYSTAEDLYKWDQALYTEKLLPKELMELYFTPQIEAWGDSFYAYGFGVGEEPLGSSKETIYVHTHGGGINGFNTNISRAPENKSLIVLLNNTGGAPLNDMTVAIRGILAGKTYDLPKKSIVPELLDEMQSNGIKAAENLFKSIKDNDGFYLSERDMNEAGYSLMADEKTKEAAAIFKMNMESYPSSANAYDSYAESQMKLGNKKEAIANYEKSLELNPMNENGVKMLEELGVDVSEYTKTVEVSNEILETYVGDYELMPGFILAVSNKGGKLITQATGQGPIPLEAISDDAFAAPDVGARITFQKDEKGKVVSLTLFQNGQEMLGSRVEE
ncbi:MAG: serine hydrolase [Flavobacteriales bacterium]